MVYDKTKQQFEEFGFLRTLSREIELGQADGCRVFVYCVFDILYTDEHGSISRYPLRKRQDILIDTVSPGSYSKDGVTLSVLNIVHPSKPCFLDNSMMAWYIDQSNREAQLKKLFDESMDRAEEGLMIKVTSSENCRLC